MTTSQLEISTKEWAEMGHQKANEILESLPLLQRLSVLQNTPQAMCPYEEWVRRSKAELIQWYMNAMTTCSCGGRGKMQRNEDAVREYSEVMKKYNIPKPSSDICYILGIFNGAGAQ